MPSHERGLGVVDAERLEERQEGGGEPASGTYAHGPACNVVEPRGVGCDCLLVRAESLQLSQDVRWKALAIPAPVEEEVFKILAARCGVVPGHAQLVCDAGVLPAKDEGTAFRRQ